MLDKPATERERPAEPSTMPFAIPTWPMPIWPSMADAASRNCRVLQGLAMLGGEWLDFVTRRLKEDVSLPVRGEKKQEREEKGETHYLFERSFGTFERCLRLPETIDESKLEARFDRGVLRITAAKRPEAVKAERKIEIKKA